MLLLLFFYILVIPFCILLHEVGHGLGAVLSSKSHARIYLGAKSERNKEDFRLGRLHFHIIWSYVGFAYFDSNLTKRQKALALAGGPFVSLILAVLFGWLTFVTSHSYIQSLFWWATLFNSLQFIATMVPIKYPRWMGGYGGYQSDGLQLLRLIKDSK